MTDREMLLMAYGALKVSNDSSANPIIDLIEEHLYPPKQDVMTAEEWHIKEEEAPGYAPRAKGRNPG